ncbi:MAG: O-antigen ligase family protein [Pseudomonadota bacterium]
MQVLVLICLTVWAFTTKRKGLGQPQFRLVLWFLIAAAISQGMAGWWGGARGTVVALAPILILFVVLTGAAQELAQLRRIMWVLIASACVMVLHGHWQLVNGVGWTGLPPLDGRITYVGIFSDPNDLGQLFTLCIAFCVYLHGSASRFWKFAIAVAVIWLCYGIYMTDSRGTMLATLAVLAIEGVRRFGKILVGIMGAGAAAVLVVTTRFGQINSGERAAVDRVEAWYEGTRMFLARPFFGVGIGNFTNYHDLTAHNFIVLPMAELGLFGFIPWFGLLWFSGLMLWWLTVQPRQALDPKLTAPEQVQAERDAALGLSAMAIGFFVSSFFLSQSYKQVLFIVVGLIVARFIHASSILADAPQYLLLRRFPLLALVSAATIFLMWITTKALL